MPEAAKYSTSLEYRQTMRKHGILCAVLVAVLGNSQVFGFPWLWDYMGGCYIPTEAYGGHKAPIWSPEIYVELSIYANNSRELFTLFQPGKKYSIVVQDAVAEKTNVWLHASSGHFIEDGVLSRTPEACTKAVFSTRDNVFHSYQWVAPTSKECVLFTVATALASDAAYRVTEVQFCPACQDTEASAPAPWDIFDYNYTLGVQHCSIGADAVVTKNPILENLLNSNSPEESEAPLSSAFLALIVTFVALGNLVCTAVVICWFYRRRSSKGAVNKSAVESEQPFKPIYGNGAVSLAAESESEHDQSSSQGNIQTDVARTSKNVLFVTSSHYREQSGISSMYEAAYPTKCSTIDSECTQGTPVIEAPDEKSTAEQRMEYVQYQIDSLSGVEVLNGLVMDTSMHSRLTGGQAVIQFAKEKNTALEYALKFFLSRTAFREEETLYADTSSPLGKFLPMVRNIVSNEDGAFTDKHGNAMPPCICMEKGESLDMWIKRIPEGLDMITALQVIHHIAARLSDLHEAGYCHRDLKPGNVMWLPRRNRWTLIDFGCAARIGEDACIGYSLAYAAPEVIKAAKDKQETMHVSDKLDAWSLGVMAVELLTNKPPFNLLEGSNKVMDRIVGELPLPWEDPEIAPALLRRFGHFKLPVMSLLERDPSKRPSMNEFLKECNRVLMHTTKGDCSATLPLASDS